MLAHVETARASVRSRRFHRALLNSRSLWYSLRVPITVKTRRRWFGALCLLTALGMLVAGETTPGERLNGAAFVIYWLTCFGFAALAMLFGILDARALRREARAEQQALLEDALEEIQTEKGTRSQAPESPESPASNSPGPG